MGFCCALNPDFLTPLIFVKKCKEIRTWQLKGFCSAIVRTSSAVQLQYLSSKPSVKAAGRYPVHASLLRGERCANAGVRGDGLAWGKAATQCNFSATRGLREPAGVCGHGCAARDAPGLRPACGGAALGTGRFPALGPAGRGWRLCAGGNDSKWDVTGLSRTENIGNGCA